MSNIYENFQSEILSQNYDFSKTPYQDASKATVSMMTIPNVGDDSNWDFWIELCDIGDYIKIEYAASWMLENGQFCHQHPKIVTNTFDISLIEPNLIDVLV